jgi:hypothetical protein
MKINTSIISIGLILLIAINLFLAAFFKERTNDLKLNRKLNLPTTERVLDIVIRKEESSKKLELDTTYNPNKQVFFSITNLGNEDVPPQLVLNEKDWFSNIGILESAISEKMKKPYENSMISLWQFVVDNRYNHIPALSLNDFSMVENPVQYLNSWGYGFCDDSATVLAQLAHLAGYKSRVVSLEGHVVMESFYNGSWHMFDADNELYVTNSKNEIVGVEEIYEDTSLIKIAVDKFDRPEWIYRLQMNAYSEDKPRFITYADTFYPDNLPESFSYTLRPKEQIIFYNDWKDKYDWSWIAKEPPLYSNGLLLTSIPKQNAWNRLFKKNEYINFNLPYPILGVFVSGKNICKYADRILISLNNNWYSAGNFCQNDILDLTEVIPIGVGTKPTHNYFLKTTKLNIPLHVVTQFQVSPFSIPQLLVGNNFLRLKQPLGEDIKIKFGFSE